ncbi:MAG TPA: multiheme c-type cytochrome [Dermatophilaceae bacterium]|nr:multiheme c-type cytochrome [Dermatophilaceae bacterium]
MMTQLTTVLLGLSLSLATAGCRNMSRTNKSNHLFVAALVASATMMVASGCGDLEPHGVPVPAKDSPARASGVCPPFQLRDEAGNVIDPVKGVNDTVPYSPRQTCGASGCHDYGKITEGFHFTQGKGEQVPAVMAERYAWVTSPGNYGGNWCSPAPLYRQLAPKKNANARGIDMTSFDFVTATCGTCHPGGGPMELDRDGKRYDTWMRDPASGLTAGGENGLDGDYFKARWSETGVIEADCLLCHQPEYDFKRRNAELANLNFRWAATAGAGLGTVTGKVNASEEPTVTYDKSRFDADGNVLVHIAPEPRNETCLTCHAKPDWKKRGAAYSTRTDVHMAAGLRCVDCHAAGSNAVDPRIRGREVHQFGKGDDPSGWVRNDLDDTVRSCESCHLEGWRNSPRATHAWLPPLHMEKLACQTCHIPTRAVKSALVQASDIYNPAPRITPPPKHIWTFYDQDMAFWNHYGEINLFTNRDQPTDVTRPTLIRYKGKVYPGNRVHSAWVGFEEQGKPGLNQLFMKDFFQMWSQHRADPKGKYPELAKIADDNQDGIIEVNRPEEIDALLAASRAHLTATGFPLDGRRLVWVANSKAYYSATESRNLPREEWEATAYASVYKFSHDVSPAQAALGSGGCTDCHRSGSPFFQGAVLDAVFTGDDARPRWIPNHQILGVSSFWVKLGAFREAWLKPVVYGLGAAVLLLLAGLGLRRLLVARLGVRPHHAALLASVASGIGVVGVLVLAASPDWLSYVIIRRFTLDANHAWVSLACLGVGAATALLPLATSGWRRKTLHLINVVIWAGLAAGAVSGVLMFVKLEALAALTRLAYTGLELGLALALLGAVVSLALRVTTIADGRTIAPAGVPNPESTAK